MKTRWLAPLALAALLAACAQTGALSGVSVAPALISPNADGKDDVARISYRINSPAVVSIYLTGGDGKRYDLRLEEQRPPSPVPYEHFFSGVSNGRLIPNGDYTWHVEAKTASGAESATGKLQVRDASLPFPAIRDFTLSSRTLSPNRDAIDDHIYINTYLTAKARLSVYITDNKGYRFDVPRREGLRILPSNDAVPLEPGRYEYDYDGGINSNAEPPPDGRYILVAQSEDRVGQRDILTAPITLVDSGRPAAEIVIQPDGDGIHWSRSGRGTTLQVGDTLYFTTTVRNTSNVPIRTAGPFSPAPCYNMDENWYSKGFKQEPGIFRIGLDFESNSGADHPFRWAVGREQDLDVVVRDGVKLYYLGRGKQAQITGCVKLTRVPTRNPFYVYGSLIQEDVEIVNYQVTPLLVQLVTP